MSITYHERPGVYSDYDASSVTATGSTERVIALAGVSEAKSGLYTVTSYASGRDTFGESSQLGRMLKLVYQNGAGTVLACPVAEDTEAAYQAALTLLLGPAAAVLLLFFSLLLHTAAQLLLFLTVTLTGIRLGSGAGTIFLIVLLVLIQTAGQALGMPIRHIRAAVLAIRHGILPLL